MKIYTTLILIFLINQISVCQQRNVNIDSIKSLALVEQHDSVSLSNLIYLAYLYESEDPSFSINCSQNARQAAQLLPYEEIYMKSYYMEAKVRSFLGQFEEALLLLDTLSSHPNIESYTEVVCDCHKALANIYKEKRNLDLAIEHYIISIENGKLVDDFGCWGGGLLNLGHLHHDARNYEMAEYYYSEAKQVLLDTDRYHILCYVYRNLAKYEDNYAQAKLMIDSSFFYADLAKNIHEKYLSYIDLGNLEYNYKQYNNAIKSYEKGFEFYNSNETFDGLTFTYLRLAISNLKIGNDSIATYWYDRHTESRTGNPEIESKAVYHSLLSGYYKNKGDYKSALESFEIYKQLSDGSLKEIGLQDFNDKETKYRTLEKEKQIAEQELQLEKERNTKNRLLLFGTILLSLASGIYFLYYTKQRRENELAEQALQVEIERTENLQQLDSLKDQFFTNISHELRTPLTLITEPLAKVLKKSLNEEHKEDIDLAHRNSKRLLGLINEIMDLSKLEAGKILIHKEPIEIISFCRRVFLAFESLAKTREIKLKFPEFTHHHIVVYTDPKHVERILNNLISNAIKFSKNGQQVEFVINEHEDLIKLSVIDTGRGISKMDLPLVFERYYQARQGKDFTGGSGVGLALAKELSELLTGELKVKSEIGVGSTFSLHLPKTNEHALSDALKVDEGILHHEEKEELEDNYSPLFINGDKPKILVLEDNADMAKYLVELLSPDYRCSVSINGVDGLRVIQKNQFDLILSDVMMPGLNGFELKTRVNKFFEDDVVPYVFLTARSLEEDVLKGLRLGVDDYITKPFNSDELLVRIYNLVKNRIERKATDGHQMQGPEKERFIKTLEMNVLKNLDNSQFKVSDLARDMAIGQKQLSRKVKAFTGLTSKEIILEIRLQKAKQLISRQIYTNLGDIRLEVGIDSASYFSRKYKQRFGLSPIQDLSSQN